MSVYSNGSVMTGIAAIDENGGLPRGGISALCGYSSHGKSAMGLQMCVHAAESGGSLFVNLQDTADALGQRFLRGELGISSRELKELAPDDPAVTNALSTRKAKNLRTYSKTSVASPSDTFDRARKTLANFEKNLRELIVGGRTDLVVIDSYRCAQHDVEDANKHTVAAMLSRVAKELGCAIVVIAHVNRDERHNVKLRPHPDAVDQGVGLMAHADLVLMVYSLTGDEPFTNDGPNPIELWGRDATGEIEFTGKLDFDAKALRFRSP